ncbi:MAG: HTH domain-containing protein, partial [Gemmatimonadales bacterium]
SDLGIDTLASPPVHGTLAALPQQARIKTRRDAILRLLTGSPTLLTERALANQLGVAPRTVRADIATLRRSGQLPVPLPR